METAIWATQTATKQQDNRSGRFLRLPTMGLQRSEITKMTLLHEGIPTTMTRWEECPKTTCLAAASHRCRTAITRTRYPRVEQTSALHPLQHLVDPNLTHPIQFLMPLFSASPSFLPSKTPPRAIYEPYQSLRKARPAMTSLSTLRHLQLLDYMVDGSLNVPALREPRKGRLQALALDIVGLGEIGWINSDSSSKRTNTFAT